MITIKTRAAADNKLFSIEKKKEYFDYLTESANHFKLKHLSNNSLLHNIFNDFDKHYYNTFEIKSNDENDKQDLNNYIEAMFSKVKSEWHLENPKILNQP